MTEIAIRQPASLDGSVRFAQLLADADLLPKQFVGKPANVLYAIEYGRTLGITPVAAITGIHVIEGKPSASSGLIGALVRQAGHKLRVKSDGGTTATAQIVRADDPGFTYECTWTLERAVQAGLCQVKDNKPWARDRNGKPTAWEKYPAAMLKARAITEVARDACEDVLFGLHYTPEELGAIVNQDGEPVEATVQQLHRVQPGETDPWASAPDQMISAVSKDRLVDLTQFVLMAEEAPDADAVRAIWQQAKQAGAPEHLLDKIVATGRERAAAAEPGPAAEVVDAEVVTTPEDDYAAAVAELRAAAEAAHLEDFDNGVAGALGMPLAEAPVEAIRALAAQIRPAA
ncbi:hypothetical protein STHAL_18340 [Streptomyces halstedii]|uniref:Recombinase RecT n=1 Tax=Streptomyces halstedii TaxID=1944 RepID=A0ABS6TTC9_STRHA|nr:hypothetical protein [Streptomyces halstedii]MBV7671411.1 hypothetical protein [Streptomyces halstedii]